MVIGLFWGALIITPLLLASGNVSFAGADWRDIAAMVILQGFVIGIMAMVLFSYAVRLLGAAESAAFGALTPILALLGGVLFLGESVTYLKIFGIILVAVGVFLASGIIRKYHP